MAAAAVAVGFLIGAVQYLPVLEYVPYSPRAGGKGWEHAVSYSMPIEELINMYLPQFTGILEDYWGRNGIHFHSEYLGAAALLLAFAGVRRQRRDGRGSGGSGSACSSCRVLWSLGGFTPFYHIVYALVPGTKFFRAPSTMLMVVALATAVLAALGTERALAGGLTRRYLVGWVVAGLVIALLGDLGRVHVDGARDRRGLPVRPGSGDRREQGRRRARRPAQPAVPRRRGRTVDPAVSRPNRRRVRWGGDSPP